jgi:thiol-disulfide isomerase/thioredoxin
MVDAISIGPAAVPPQVLAALVSLAAGGLVLHLVGRRNPTLQAGVSQLADHIFTALIVAFLVWKLMPLVFWWDAIVDEPMRLLRLPGGRWGVAAGTIVFAGMVIPRLWNEPRLIRPAAVGAFSVAITYAVVVAALSAVGATGTGPASAEILQIQTTVLERTPNGVDRRDERLLSGDQPAVVTFWATWCGPCHAEIPVKQEAYNVHGDDIRVVAVNMTHTESGDAAIINYIHENELNYPVALDRTGAISALFGVRGTPTTVILSSSGEVVDRWMGPSDLGRINRAVRSVNAPSSVGARIHDPSGVAHIR